jgi:hypothetical protein
MQQQHQVLLLLMAMQLLQVLSTSRYTLLAAANLANCQLVLLLLLQQQPAVQAPSQQMQHLQPRQS